MPVYEYECKKCGNRFEQIERIADHGAKRVRCPACKSTSVRQVIGGIHVQTSKKS